MIRLAHLIVGLVLALAAPAAAAAPAGAEIAGVARVTTLPDAPPCGTADHRPADCAATCAWIAALPVIGETPSPKPVAMPAPARQAIPRGATRAPEPPPPRPLSRA